MPGLDGTGPLGQGPVGAGRGMGRGNRPGRRMNATKECTCPKCGHTMQSQRGVPCTEINCPKCETPMKGSYCK